MTILCSTDLDPTDLVEKYLGGLGLKVPLQYGDFVYEARGWGDEPISVCVERKRLRDLVNSLVLSKRLVQQFRDARTAHQVHYLIAEVGSYRKGESSVIEVKQNGEWKPYNFGSKDKSIYIGWDRLESCLESLTVVDRVIVHKTFGPKETAQKLLHLYHWWSVAPEQHTTTQAFYSGPVPFAGKLSLVRRVAKELPEIGWELSGRIERRFKDVREMVNAPVADWESVEGIGKKIAQGVDLALGERKS